MYENETNYMDRVTKGAPSIYARYAVAYHFWQLSWENNVNSNC